MPDLPKKVRNDLFVLDFFNKLPCVWRKECAAAGSGCDQLAALDCPSGIRMLGRSLFTSCPFVGRGRIIQSPEQLLGFDCKACRACE